ncbi:LAMI_0G04764g1_1 [Lachancea mirantina]|uniref:LAMI_0G04764g1_1 n=1 Tax=Lachancea mirantina TaxID=1230905 RepID=A0A1G4K8R9_9SACH|nr:LAMI_0G04764g1_1 [Lachancea mirantina]
MNTKLNPEILWAQRSSDSDPEKNYLLVTLMISDCEDPKLDLQPGYLEFSAKSPGHVGDEEEHKYQLRLDFYKEIDPAKSLHKIANGRDYFLKLVKKDLDAEYWPRLTKEKLKYHYIKTDFNKWVDEDEQEEHESEDFGFQGAAGGAGGAGFPGGAGGDFDPAQMAAMQQMLQAQAGAGGQGSQMDKLNELLQSGGQGLEGLDELEEEADLAKSEEEAA